jgi:hypothetical protein
MLGAFVIVALVVPLCVSDLESKLLTAKLTFMSLGMLFAVLQVFLGVLLALIGVTIDYDVDAAVGPAKLKRASASPGILLLLVGNFLFGFSLMQQSEVTRMVKEFRAGQNSQQQSSAAQSTNGPHEVEPIDTTGKKGGP